MNPGGSGNGNAAVDEMLTIEPLPCSHRYGTTAFDALTMPMKFTARNSSHVAVSWSNMSAALFTRQSTRPRSSTTFAIAVLHLLGVGHVGLQRDAATTEAFDVLLHLVRLVDALQVDDGDVGPVGRHRPRVRGADALGTPGDDAHLAGQSLAHSLPFSSSKSSSGRAW